MTIAGELRWKIAFDQRQDVDDEYGNTQSGFVQQFVVRAEVKAKFGGEAVTSARLAGQQPVTICVRQSVRTKKIDESWRARDIRNGKEYAIRSIVDPDGKGRWLEILTQTGVAA